MAGDSIIDMDRNYSPRERISKLEKPRIIRNADAMTGGWSIGKSDQNLLYYIASIAYQYMTVNY